MMNNGGPASGWRPEGEAGGDSGERKMSLSGFLKKNSHLVTALGVLVAVTAYTTGLPHRPVGTVISFLFLTMSVLVFLELLRRFPAAEGSVVLVVFENLLALAVLALVAYWLLHMAEFLPYLVPVFVFMCLASLFSYIIKSLDLFNRVFRTSSRSRGGLRFIVWLILICGMLFVSHRASVVAGPHVQRTLHWLYAQLLSDSTAEQTSAEAPVPQGRGDEGHDEE